MQQLSVGRHQHLERRVCIEASDSGQGVLEPLHPLAHWVATFLAITRALLLGPARAAIGALTGTFCHASIGGRAISALPLRLNGAWGSGGPFHFFHGSSHTDSPRSGQTTRG